jgi:hypothetical protein
VGGTHPGRVPLGEGALPEGHPPSLQEATRLRAFQALFGESVPRRHVDRVEVRENLLEIGGGRAVHHEARRLEQCQEFLGKIRPERFRDVAQGGVAQRASAFDAT